MKLDSIATKENSNKGVWFSPAEGIEFLVIGKDADEVKKFQREQSRAFANMTKEEAEAFDLELSAKKGVAKRIKGMRSADGEPITLNGVVLEQTEESYVKIFTEIPDLQDAIWAFSEKRTNFLPAKKKSSSALSGASSSSTIPTTSGKGTTES